MQVAAQVEVVGHRLQVGQNLGLSGVGAAPGCVGRERERVEVALDVAGRTGIGVAPPGTSDAVGALDDRPGRRSRPGATPPPWPRPPKPAPMIATLGGRRRRVAALTRPTEVPAPASRRDLEPVEIATGSPRLKDVGVFGGPTEEEAALPGLRVRLDPRGCSSPGVHVLARSAVAVERCTTVSTHAASAAGDASTSVTPRSSARAMIHATWVAWTSSRYGKFTVNPDCAMLSTKQFGKPRTCRPWKVRTPSRQRVGQASRPSRPISSKPERRQ